MARRTAGRKVPYESITDFHDVGVGDVLVAKAVKAPTHSIINCEFVNAWLTGRGSIDLIALGYERRETTISQTLGEGDAHPVVAESRTTFSTQLVEYGQVRLDRDAAGAMALTILDLIASIDPNGFQTLVAKSTVVTATARSE